MARTAAMRLRLTRAGVVYVALTLALGFAAVNTGNNLLYLLVSALLGFMSLSGWLGHRNLQRLTPTLHLPEEVYAGRPTLARLRLVNGKRRLPSFLLDVACGETMRPTLEVPPGGHTDLYLPLRFARRGPQPLPPLELRSPFPVNFFVRSLRLPLPQRVTVFPAPRRVSPPPAAGGLDRGTQAAITANGEGEMRGIREYAGEPLRQIHWRLSARQRELLVKLHTATADEPLLIDLAAVPGRGLEQRLGGACWLVREGLRRQRPTGLRLGDRTIPPATGRPQLLRLLRELACHAAD